MLKIAIVMGLDDCMNEFYQIIDEKEITHAYCETIVHAYQYAKEHNMKVEKVITW